VGREIETQLADSGSETILALDLFYPRISAVQDRTPLKRIILTSVRDFLPPLRRLLYPLKARLSGRWIRVEKRPPLHDFLELLNITPMETRRRSPDSNKPMWRYSNIRAAQPASPRA